MTTSAPRALDRLLQEMRARSGLFDRLAPGVDDLLRELKGLEGPPDITAIKKIMKVKLQKRAVRPLELISTVPNEITEKIVRDAIDLKHKDAPEAVEAVRISLLCALPGVEVPVASAILAWTNPLSYGVLDRRAWNTLQRFKLVKSRSKENSTYTATDWAMYLSLLRTIAREIRKTPQKIDTWLYAYDKAKLS